MVNGIIGKKVGMTQLFLEDGTVAPATVLQAGPCVVVQGKNGAERRLRGGADRPRREQAVRGEQGDRRATSRRPTCRRRACAARCRLPRAPRRRSPATRCCARSSTQGERVDVIGTSKGKGFQGTVKRHHFRGGDETHGSMFHRAPGSIGASSYPSRVFPGMRMHGHMGDRPRHDAQSEGAEGRRREQPDRGARRTCRAPTAATC